MSKPLINIALASFIFFISTAAGFAQKPVIRNSKPGKLPPATNPKIKPIATNDNLKISPNVFTNAMSSYYSLLNFAEQKAKDVESHAPGNIYYELTKWQSNTISNQPASKNWSKQLLWNKIPKMAAYGRWEISLLPFPPSEDSDFTGVIRNGLVETRGADSLFINLNYSDVPEEKLVISRDANNKNGGNIKLKNNTAAGNQQSQSQEKSIYGDISNGKLLLSKFRITPDGPRKFYIRIVPLDKTRNALRKISNDIVMQEEMGKTFKQPPLSLEQDYAITNIKYTPVQFPNYNYSSCVIVAGYNGEESWNSGWGSFEDFKKNFPIGTTMCPEPQKDKSWFEKVLGSAFDFLINLIDAAANCYNDTKAFIKEKFKEFSCNSGTMAVLNPGLIADSLVSDDLCKTISGAAFDYGMAAIGIPPSLPTSEDLMKMAEGELVELACDNFENATGVPVPEEAREQIRQQTHKFLTEQSQNGTIKSGNLNLKAHPLGLFHPAYLELEVTRVSKNSSEKKVVSIPISDETSRTVKSYNKAEKKGVDVNVSGRLFEPTTGAVPYIENIGDKTTVYIILKPQDSYVYTDDYTHVIKNIKNYPSTPEDLPAPTFEGNANTTGFQTLCQGGSLTTFKFGGWIKKTESVNSAFINK